MEYLRTKHEVHRTGWWWWSTRPIRALGLRQQRRRRCRRSEKMPAARIELIVFVPASECTLKQPRWRSIAPGCAQRSLGFEMKHFQCKFLPYNEPESLIRFKDRMHARSSFADNAGPRVELLYYFCRLQMPAVDLPRERCRHHLQRTFALYSRKRSNTPITWEAYLDQLYPLDWFLASACLEGNRSGLGAAFRLAGRPQRLPVDGRLAGPCRPALSAR